MALSPGRRLTVASFVTLLVLILGINLALVSPYLLAVLTGALLALISRPAHHRLQRWGMGPRLSALLVTLGLTVLVVGPVTGFSVRAVQQGAGLARQAGQNGALSPRSLMATVSQSRAVQMLVGDAQMIEERLRTAAEKGLSTVTAALFSILGSLPNLALQAALALISCYFLLVDGRRLVGWMGDKVPLEPEIRTNLMASFRDTAVSVVLATIAAAAVQSVIIMAGFLALGVPAAFLAGGATFLFAWIPMLGTTPVWLAGAAYLYFQGALGKALLMLGVGMVASVADNFVRPWVLKGRADMHPLVSLVAIFGGIHFFGIIGVFFGPILMAIAISMLAIWPSVRRKMTGMDVTPPMEPFSRVS